MATERLIIGHESLRQKIYGRAHTHHIYDGTRYIDVEKSWIDSRRMQRSLHASCVAIVPELLQHENTSVPIHQSILRADNPNIFPSNALRKQYRSSKKLPTRTMCWMDKQRWEEFF